MNIKAYLFLTIATLFWGGNAVAGKMAVGHVSPLLLTSMRWAVALAIILAVMTPQIRRDWPKVKESWKLLMGLGVVGFTLFNVLLYTALNFTTAINVSIEQAGIPVVIFLFNFILFRIKASPAQMLGFTVTLIGIITTATHGNITAIGSLSLNFGDLLMLGAVLCYSVYTIMLRWKPAVHWQTLIAASAFGALVSALPLLAFEFASGAMIAPDVTGWSVILYTAIFPSLASQVLYVRGVELIGANRAGLFINAIPIFGTLLSLLFLGEALQTFHVVALLLVLAGIAIAERGAPKRIA
ncbi:EamA domain-containing membrane protein RarD [Rhizobium sp. RU20A]|uniref:DMT family transporter n=1 Tax=Rhizobium sp. RU20A TaxID=1907412 RepID=UPI000956D098|nr:DMT family transporter [Rhizobium sp. RU20A]SIQ37168.1 EamA domain-containing membrane protein RarD [Rhizobium sp. RU20A]